jgi:hypothetical protein
VNPDNEKLSVEPGWEEPPPPPRRGRWIVLAIVLLVLLALGVVVFTQTTGRPQSNTLSIKLSPGGGFASRAMVTIENKGGASVLIWQPVRIERKETGRIVADATMNRPLPLRGTNSTGAGSRIRMVSVELPGTNHGPWRMLVPVSRYELLARGESLFHQPLGAWANKFSLLATLLRRSQTWVASDWFDDHTRDRFPRFPTPGIATGAAGGFTGYGPSRFPGSANLTSNEIALVQKAELERLKTTEFTVPAPVPRLTPGLNPPTNMPWNPSQFPVQSSPSDARAFMSLLREFHKLANRWPTNFSEVSSFARFTGEPVPPASFDDATFSDTNGVLTVAYAHGAGKISLSGYSTSSGISRVLPPRPARATSDFPTFAETPSGFSRLQPARPLRAPEPPTFATAPSFADMDRRQDESRTFMFILRNFRAHYKRWPANIAEVKAFALDPANLQPEFSSSYETGMYSNAVFTTKSDGGLQINYRNGTMGISAPK